MSISSFEVLKKIGEGAYSQVFKVRRKSDDMIYALKKVKIMNLNDKEKENALNEVRILASIHHPNVISYKEAFLDDETCTLCLIMEYADGGDLYQKILEHQKKSSYMNEKFVWNLFIQLTRGLKALHDLNILHRDLKSANVFLNSDGMIKLGDMNVSKVAKNGFLSTQTGTPYYASPEVWKDKPYNKKSDIWSLGCVVYECVTLNPPFRADSMQGLYKRVTKGEYKRIPKNYSSDLHNLVSVLLQVAPSRRPKCGKCYLDDILEMNFILKRHTIPGVIQAEEDEKESELLRTIRIPVDINTLTTKLPAPNYRDEFKLLTEAIEIHSDPALPKISLRDKFKVRDSSNFKDTIKSRRAIESKSVEPSLDISISKGSYSPVNKSYKEILINNYGSIRLPQIKYPSKESRYSSLKRAVGPVSSTPTPESDLLVSSNLSSSRRAGLFKIRYPKSSKISSNLSGKMMIL